ncbi:MAG: CorA family divalent cation transporter [Candidatus Paceibacterota bacterium]
MFIKNAYKNVTWVDVTKPNKDEVRSLAEEYNLSPEIAGELLIQTNKPNVVLGDGYFYVTLHFPALRHSHTDATDQEIKFIVAKNFIITVHYDAIDPIHKFSKIFEVNTILEAYSSTVTGGTIFSHMMIKLYGALVHELECVNDELREIKNSIFDSKEKEMVFKLSSVHHSALSIRHGISTHRRVLSRLSAISTKFFGEDYRESVNDIEDEYEHVSALTQDTQEFLAELRSTNDALLQTKQNDTIHFLTVLSFITLPLSLIASILGMNTTINPLTKVPNDFWVVIGIMSLIALLTALYFKRKKWL